MTPYIDFSQSITADNGKEFAGHEDVAMPSLTSKMVMRKSIYAKNGEN